MTNERWFRYDAIRYVGDRVSVHCYDYAIIKRTAKGVWLDLGGGERKFVLSDARKRWACPTQEDALESFLARKRRQLAILRAQARHVELAIAASCGSAPEDADWFSLTTGETESGAAVSAHGSPT